MDIISLPAVKVDLTATYPSLYFLRALAAAISALNLSEISVLFASISINLVFQEEFLVLFRSSGSSYLSLDA